MIDSATAIQLMRAELLQKPIHLGSMSSKEIAIRCPFCGDSVKDQNHAHLYIGMQPNSRDGTASFPMHCKLCGHPRGVMSVEDAKTIGITSDDLLEYLGKLKGVKNSKFQKSGSNVIAKKFDFHKTEGINEKILNEDMSAKKDYLWNRLGSQELCDNPEKFKVILNLRSFFMRNNLTPNFDYGKKIKEYLAYYHQNCIGFVSFDNTHINFRDISPNPYRRYNQYMIYPERVIHKNGVKQETSGIYVVPNAINIMSRGLKLVMAEGSFDILRVFLDFYKGEQSSTTIFASVSNSHGYVPCLTKFLEYGVMFEEVEIYSDDDVQYNTYPKFVKPLVPDAKMTVFYNRAYKDVGDITKPLKLERHFV